MRKILALILLFSMIFTVSGCDYFEADGNLNIFHQFGDNYGGGTDDSSNSIWESDASYYNNEVQKDSQTPTFYTLDELSRYLNRQKENNVFQNSFYYKGSEEFTLQTLAQMVSCFYISNTQHGIDSDLYNITISEYPGDRIIDYYFGNNQVTLTADEQKALAQASQMVSLLKSKTDDEWELELAIHDMLAEHITYYDEDGYTIDTDNPPRFLTAIGALLDGKANCQGYGDAFYLLATLAGFKVGRMNVKTKDDLHLVNTILLNEKWYVVDVTLDDQAEDGMTSYRLFNAGMDQINDLYWESYKEINKIADLSDDHSYYIRKGLVFNSHQDFALHIKNNLDFGEDTIRGVVRDETDGEGIKNAIEKALENSGRAYSYKFLYYEDGKDVYYTVKFSDY